MSHGMSGRLCLGDYAWEIFGQDGCEDDDFVEFDYGGGGIGNYWRRIYPKRRCPPSSMAFHHRTIILYQAASADDSNMRNAETEMRGKSSGTQSNTYASKVRKGDLYGSVSLSSILLLFEYWCYDEGEYSSEILSVSWIQIQGASEVVLESWWNECVICSQRPKETG